MRLYDDIHVGARNCAMRWCCVRYGGIIVVCGHIYSSMVVDDSEESDPQCSDRVACGHINSSIHIVVSGHIYSSGGS